MDGTEGVQRVGTVVYSCVDGRHRDPAPLPDPLRARAPPDDLAEFSDEELADLAAEMREAIIDTVSQTGGHLGASLGTVELTVALHAELSSPRDRIVWDVGHQAYGHKLLTGRLDGFGTLRQYGGISGFLRRVESEHDVMGAGHASTSISYATGLAEGLRHSRREGQVVAVIGDGALTGGMAYEGLNQAGALGSPITVVLNDNGMSISENVGALSKLFQRVRVNPTLTRVREELERGLAFLPGATELGGKVRDATKSLWFVPGALFEALGFAYIGPIDGHDIDGVRKRAADHARDGPAGARARQDGQGPRLPAGRGRRRGHARRHAVRHRERQGRQQEVVRARRTTPRSSATPWSRRPSATRGSSASPPPCSRARGCST